MALTVPLIHAMREATFANPDRENALKLVFIALVFSLLSTAVFAQSPDASQRDSSKQEQVVPKGFEPPAGMCRIWIDGVPAEQQAAPTDCVTAVRNRPANARVIFGPDLPRGWTKKTGGTGRSVLPRIPIIRRNDE